MKRGVTFPALWAACFYLLAYATLYHFGRPAANLAYWVYSEHRPVWTEECLYYAFYPPYLVHQRMLGGARHNYDRPTPRDAE